ncbi:hypothetical protein BDZ45DRAFT_788079 [Acephala macrosclerotiorum]|nr:hypothetical protein BDZ45DRAFT_788079 [Acephala macrosclerotiorum]
MHRVFFDEAPSDYSTKAYNYMSSAATCAKSLFLTTKFNPGVPPATKYYSLATYIVAFEGYASAFTTTPITQIPSQYREQAVFILHDLNATTMNQGNAMKELKIYGVGGIFLTAVEYYRFSGLWGQFVRAVAGG